MAASMTRIWLAGIPKSLEATNEEKNEGLKKKTEKKTNEFNLNL